jgi:hypothetical protein
MSGYQEIKSVLTELYPELKSELILNIWFSGSHEELFVHDYKRHSLYFLAAEQKNKI